MPVTELGQSAGGLGQVLGMVGGYLLGNPQRKAAQAQRDVENKRADAQAKDYHDNIQSEIQSRQHTQQTTDADAANTKYQQGAYAKLSALLKTPPPNGMTAQQWVAQVQSKVPETGLTDPKLLGQLYGEAQDVIKQEQTANATKFAGKEMALPTDPKQRLSVLFKRLQAERGVPGMDTGPTEKMIADTQKQITDMETRAFQAATLSERKRHDTAVENKPRAPRETIPRNAAGLTPAEALAEKHWNQTHNADGTPKRNQLAPKIEEEREQDYNQGLAVIKANPAAKATVVQRYAAKYNLPLSQAQQLFP
jgi:hypothetical protein